MIGVFTTVFSLISLFFKERLLIGEATVATIYGLIVGPHCLNWFAPTTWGNSDYITMELSRIALVIQIFAVAVELPSKYMLKHWVLVLILLAIVMTFGWLVVGAFMYLLIPGINFASALVIAACTTATDPVLAAAVVGKGKFARKVPGHLRNVLSAESGANDGMAFPFLFLGLYLVMDKGHPGEIIKNWICITILYECVFGCLLGVVIGYCGRRAIRFAKDKGLIDTESFLAFYIVLTLICTGFGSILGVDDLLTSFAAGSTFAWDGWFAKETEETHVSSVIDLLLNISYFIYFGSIVPWEQFNNGGLGMDVWRLILIAVALLFLRRIPIVLAMKPFIPDVKTWREALFCGHFGPVGVGAIFTAMLAKSELESIDLLESTPLRETPGPGLKNYQLINCIWPIVSFIVISSMVIHGSLAAVLTLGRHLNSTTITMSFTNTRDTSGGLTWLNRLPKLDSLGRSFLLRRVESKGQKKKWAKGNDEELAVEKTERVKTSGIKYRPAGGIGKSDRRKRRKHRNPDFIEKNRPEAEQFYLGEERRETPASETHTEQGTVYREGDSAVVEREDGEVVGIVDMDSPEESKDDTKVETPSSEETEERKREKPASKMFEIRGQDRSRKGYVYTVGDMFVVENEQGEVVRTYQIHQHEDEGRGRLGLLVERTLSAVGLRKLKEDAGLQKSEGKQPLPEEDVESESDNELEDLSKDETEVERKRRLAALGSEAQPRDKDDEEED